MVTKLKTLALFFAVWLLTWPAPAFAGWPASGRYQAYQGPCDIVTCAEAYSMTRAMRKNYSGPLFQLYNGSSTLDIGQVNHVVDMSTWSAFCSGVQSNCRVSKIYAQIQTAPNNILIPSTLATGNNGVCTGGGNFYCACRFTIEAATGLPIMTTVSATGVNGTTPVVPPCMYYNGNGVMGAGDTLPTGITAGTSAMSVVFAGKPVTTPMCCGTFGLAHLANGPLVAGSDFMIDYQFGIYNNSYGCINNYNAYCFGLDLEQTGACTGPGNGAQTGNDFQNFIASTSYDPSGGTRVTSYVDGILISDTSPSQCTMNVPGYLRVGGGGDLSGAPTFFREGFITNTAMSGAQHLAVANNMKAFYSPMQYLNSNFRNWGGNSTGGAGSSIAVAMPVLSSGSSANQPPTLSGSMLIVSISWCQTMACTITGSVHVSSVTSSNVGETCSQAPNAASLAAAGSSDIWYCPNIKGGSDTITVNTTGGSPGFLTAVVSEWTRLQTVDGTLASSATTASNTMTLTTNGNVTRPGEVVYSIMSRGGTGLTSSSSQLPVSVEGPPGGTIGPTDVYQVTTTPGITYSNTMNWTGSGLVASGSLAVFH